MAGLGIANQRETTLIWDRKTGEPIHNAIVWQDRRTAPMCAELKAHGHEPLIAARTGLLLDPYFSATKIAWLLDNIAGRARPGRARRARLRHRRQLSAVAAHRRRRRTRPTPPTPRAPCCSTSTRAIGTTNCSRCSACRARCCRRCGTARPISASRRRSILAAAADPRRRGRPAGGADRPSLLSPWHGEVDLRHRRLRPA